MLVDLFTSPGMTDEAVRIYLARGVTEVPADEQRLRRHGTRRPTCRCAWVPLDEAVRAVLAGELHNPLAVMGILAALPPPRHRGFARDRLAAMSASPGHVGGERCGH